MKFKHSHVVVFKLAVLASTAAQAGALEDALCRGPYPTMLMTEAECQAHVRHVQELQSRGETQALLALQQRHMRLLEERAEACRCAFDQSEGIHVEHTAALSAGC